VRISEGAGVRGGLSILLLTTLGWTGCGGPRHAPADATAQRVVCASPAVAEIVFALGVGERVVGVSDFSDWPPEAKAKPRIGGALVPNREVILALQPNLILAQGRAEILHRFATAQGIHFAAWPLDTLADLRAMIRGIATTLGEDEHGRQLVARLDADFAALAPERMTPVFIALSHAPGELAGLMTAGPHTFLSELVELAGGQNIFADVTASWPHISQETLVRRRPELILDFQPTQLSDAQRTALLADWGKLGFSPEQVRILEEDYLLKPGPRAPVAAGIIAAALQPLTSGMGQRNAPVSR